MKSRKRATVELESPVTDTTGVRLLSDCNHCEPGNHSQHLTPEQRMDACEEEIRQLAYQKWEQAGCPSGDGFDFWIEAERDVMSRLETL